MKNGPSEVLAGDIPRCKAISIEHQCFINSVFHSDHQISQSLLHPFQLICSELRKLSV